jgi:Mn-dependent DtxR family transcriptional regulator
VNKSSSVSFTEKQGQYLSFISNFLKLNGRPPAEADMQKYFGVTPPTTHQMVVRLESLGLIKRTPGVGRSIQLLVPSDEIPSLK